MRADPISRVDSPAFRDLSLAQPLLRVLNDVGYEAPSPIQAANVVVGGQQLQLSRAAGGPRGRGRRGNAPQDGGGPGAE